MTTDTICCKVQRVELEYNLDGLRTILKQKHGEGMSLRDLSDIINLRILNKELEDSDTDFGSDLDSIYEGLTGDVSYEREADIRDRLKKADIPLEKIEEDFTSHETVRRHFRGCLDITTERTSEIGLAEGKRILRWSETRHRSVLDDILNKLRDSGHVEFGDSDVIIDSELRCRDCGETYSIDEFLSRKQCACADQ